MNVKHSQRGAVALEFGLGFLIFFSVVYGVMEFGRLVACYNILSGAAREGVRYASVHGSASGSAATAADIQDVVRHWALGMETSSVAVTTTWTPGKVTANYSVTPFTQLILKNGINVQSSAQMAISQ
jgi:Flp pilus assembly protein TadG